MGGEEKRERGGAGKASGKKVAKWLVKLAGIAKARRHPCLLGRSHFVPPPPLMHLQMGAKSARWEKISISVK